MVQIPGPTTITAEWLTDCLRGAGHAGVTVRGFKAHNIGTGQIGQCLRIEMELANASDDTPRTLVGKFPSDDDASRATGVNLRNYYREVRFYQTLAEVVDMPTPRCYFAEIVDDGPLFALLLEDMAPAQPGDQLKGCNAAVAHAAVQALVGLQVPSWNDEALKQHDWLHVPPDPDMPATSALYSQLLPGFVERFGAALTPAQIDIIERVGSSTRCPLFEPLGAPFCLEHIDYRLDNLLIDERASPPRVTVVDWQSVKVGRPLNDVAYFLGAGMLPEHRREVEEDIVRDYHTALTAAGVQDYDWDRCWTDYRRGAFSGFAVTVVASMIVARTERGDAMFTAMASRHSQHALDLGADEFL